MYRVLLRTLYDDRACPASPGLRIRSGTVRVASRWTLRLPRWVWLAALLAAVASLELRTSWVQSLVLARAVGRLTYTLGPGRSASIRFPVTGPYDIRLGYAKEREFVKRLEASGYEVEAQARWSPQLVGLADAGFFPVYPVKNQAGLSVLDRSDRSIFSLRSPRYAYRDFTDIPPMVCSRCCLSRTASSCALITRIAIPRWSTTASRRRCWTSD